MNLPSLPNKFPANGYVPVSSKALDSNIINVNKPADLFKELGWGTVGRGLFGALIAAKLLGKRAANTNDLLDLIKKNS